MTEKNLHSGINSGRLIGFSLPGTSFYRINTGRRIKDAPVIKAIYAGLKLSPRAGNRQSGLSVFYPG
ncbi:hypothetical protein UA45_00940 [Morganella morganii]|uniref:Uncharacterized protein n=1 Tax=Morganella morganii TaxID=582 RepID=A0A0D8LBG2_MORMO|nr:hypothetical protein UA45_00940 [Morganella morganii]